MKSSVDWLTEVVHRLSEAAMDGVMNNVQIKLMRLDKAWSFFFFYQEGPNIEL